MPLTPGETSRCLFQFKNRAGDIRELGQRMNVDAIMEGSVRREPGRIRVTVQLNSHRRRGSASSMTTAVEFYRQAIERDPSFAEAYVGLAILLNEAGTDGRLKPAEAFPQSQAAVTKALELNPLLASAYSAQGWISMHYDWNWDAAERNLRRAIELSPADPETHHSYSHYLLARKRFRESLTESQRAIDLDPLNAGIRGHLVLHFDMARE